MKKTTKTVAACLVGAMLSVLAVSARAQVATYTDEATYMAALAAAGAGTFQEGFEDAATWGDTRSNPRPVSVTGLGITWTSNNAISRIATGLGGARTGFYGIYSTPHGITVGIPDVTEQRDGFIGTRTGTGTLIGVGGWVRAGTAGAEVGFVLTSDSVSTAYGFTDATLTGAHKFFGVIDEAGFETFEVYEMEGRVDDLRSIFADDFTFGALGPGANQAPVANAGPDQTVLVTDTVTLDGGTSSDVDGDPLTYAWSLTVPAGSAAALSDGTAVSPTFVVDVAGSYIAQLIVDDGTLDSAPDTVSISTENSAPVANAGADQTVLVTDTVTLDGAASSDVDGDPLTYTWSLTAPAGSAAALSDSAAVSPTFVVDVAGSYIAQLIVDDGTLDSAPDTVSISTENSAPVSNAGADQTVLVTDTVTLDGAASSDVDGDALTYAWSLTVPAGSAAALSDSTAVSPAFVVDVAGSYTAQLIVDDGTLGSAPDTVVIGTENSAPVDNNGPDQTAMVTVSDREWDETAVRRVLHTFAYGGGATDDQINLWSSMAPANAIGEMLTFDAVNARLSPIEDVTSDHAGSLQALQAFWSSNSAENLTCPDDRAAFNETNVRADGNTVLRNLGLQNTWIQAVKKRGLNPFRHKVGFWLVNYQMAVNLHDTEPPLIQELYDSALDALELGAPFHEVLALGATSAAVAREYGHRTNTYNNNTGVFRGNDDFAREFHQLFFRINGDTEDPDYHENTTIEHTAWALTGMRIDKEPDAYGTTRTRDWWIAPIDFTDHFDSTGRRLQNLTRHHWGSLEILHGEISGATAEDKLFALAAVAIEHPESLDNLPVWIVEFFADDNLTDDEIVDIRAAWRDVAGQGQDLLRFLQAYAISTAFHRADTFKYRTAFSRNLTIYNLNTVDNEEAYGNSFSPRSTMARQGADVFIPVHDVFGGQTSLNAANNPNVFKEAYNSSVDFPNRIARSTDVCRDVDGTRLNTWRKDWARAIPANNGVYSVKDVAAWLWQRFIGDNGENYGPLEQAQVTALLATGLDLGYLVDANNPSIAYSAQEIEAEPVASIVAANEAALMALDTSLARDRREANRRVGMAINFIGMTPFMFATMGPSVADPTPVTVPDVVGQTQAGAESSIIDAGLTVGTFTSGSSDTVPMGDIISQTPSGGTSVAAGFAVDLLVSSGAATVPVPDVGGLSQTAADEAIAAAGLASDVSDANSDTVPADHVITQSPLAGSRVAPGSIVNLVVSLGPPLNQRPLVTIDTPSDGDAFDEGTEIDFGATASDLEDGDLTADLVWTSDLDGQIGMGGSFATTLSLGIHTISVSATDSDGQSDSDAIMVTVGRPVEADGLRCKEAELKVKKGQFMLEVKSSDRSGARVLTAELDIDGDGVFERELGVMPIKRGSLDTYQRTDVLSADSGLTGLSEVRVTSDIGGVCSKTVKID